MREKSLLDAENHVFLSEEILTEILSYLEAKYLLRCKSVCKLWCAVIRSKQLVELHVIRNGHRYYNADIEYESTNSDMIVDDIGYICHQGLILSKVYAVSLVGVTTYRITNLTTNYSMDLPHPHNRPLGESMRLFLNTCTGSYNVLYVCFDTEKKTRHVKLLDLGGQSNDPSPNTDLSWTSLNIPEFENVSPVKRQFYKYCMSDEGSIILYIFSKPSIGKFEIKCIDIVTLTCTTLDVPLNLRPLPWEGIGFDLWRGKPSIVFIYQDELNILVLEDYRTQKWADTIVFPLPSPKSYPDMRFIEPCISTTPFPKSYPHTRFTEPRISTDDTVKMLMWWDFPFPTSEQCVYKLKSKVLSFVPSWPKFAATLVSVRGMQPKKKEALIKLYSLLYGT